jgi:hypothetical protein
VRRLTVKLKGRTTMSDRRRGRTLSFSARGDTTVHHGPLQRLLAGITPKSDMPKPTDIMPVTI